MKFGEISRRPIYYENQKITTDLLGGLLEELNGGDFGHGMLSAGLSKAIRIGIERAFSPED